MKNGRTILEVISLDAGYSDNQVLHDVNIEVEKGEVFGIIGQNGSGKSTLIKTICGLLPMKSGHVHFDGQRIDGIQPHELVKKGISYFGQGGLVMPALTVQEHLDLCNLRRPRKLQKTYLEDTFTKFPKLKEMRGRRAGNLSGGERQMLSFGVLLMQDTSMWFLDEPSAGLSPEMVTYTSRFLTDISKERGISMLLVEHNMNLVFDLATRVGLVKGGTLTKTYNRSEFLEKDFLIKTIYN